MPSSSINVIIIGAGTGGLGLAQGLKRAGIDVAVYERDRTRRDGLQGYRVGIGLLYDNSRDYIMWGFAAADHWLPEDVTSMKGADIQQLVLDLTGDWHPNFRRIVRGGPGRTRLASSVHDAGWAIFVRLLEDKAAQHGRRVVKIGRWEPTSQTCSGCGHRDGPKPLRIRAWACQACGVVHDRDANAARNILVAAGLAETQNACGGSVSPGQPLAVAGEAGTRPGVA